MEWTNEWPTSEGWYWAYGTSYGDTTMKLSIVKVVPKGNVIRGSEFLYRREHELVFQRIELPELPTT